MERIEAFEAMLKAALEQSEAERRKMEELKAQGREKSATYRQYLGNRLFYNRLFALYRLGVAQPLTFLWQNYSPRAVETDVQEAAVLRFLQRH